MKKICDLNDKVICGLDGLSLKAPRLTARAIVKSRDGRYAVMYAGKFGLYSLPGGGIEEGEDVRSALRREISEETGCSCDLVEELGIVEENRASLDYTQINYYFIVTTTQTPGQSHMTQSEIDNQTTVLWCSLEKMVQLIEEQQFDRIQQKYLKARDVAALREYITRNLKK